MLEISRPNDVGDIANVGLTCLRQSSFWRAFSTRSLPRKPTIWLCGRVTLLHVWMAPLWQAAATMSPPAAPASSRRSRRLMAGCSPASSARMPARRSAPSRTRVSAVTEGFEAMAVLPPGYQRCRSAGVARQRVWLVSDR